MSLSLYAASAKRGKRIRRPGPGIRESADVIVYNLLHYHTSLLTKGVMVNFKLTSKGKRTFKT